MTNWRRVYSERRAVVLPLLVLLIGNVAVLALGVMPMRQSVASAHDTAFDALTSLDSARKENLATKTARTRKDEADSELARFYAEVLPKSAADASRLTDFWLHTRARQANLEFQTGQYKLEPIRESRLTRATGKILLRGTYANITRFLYDIETAEEFVVVEKVALGESGTVESTAGGIVEVTLDIATYFVTPRTGGGS